MFINTRYIQFRRSIFNSNEVFSLFKTLLITPAKKFPSHIEVQIAEVSVVNDWNIHRGILSKNILSLSDYILWLCDELNKK